MSFYPLVIIPIGLFVLKILSLFLFPDVDGMEVKLQPVDGLPSFPFIVH